jgi:hypothetical protein
LVGRRLFVDVQILRPDPPTDLSSVHAVALVDTGSTVSGIGPRIVSELGLTSYGKKRLKSATDERFVSYYLFRAGLLSDAAGTSLPFIFDKLDGFAWSRAADFEVLFGMDVLLRCDLILSRSGGARLRYG